MIANSKYKLYILVVNIIFAFYQNLSTVLEIGFNYLQVFFVYFNALNTSTIFHQVLGTI